MVPVDITYSMVAKVTQQLSWLAAPGGLGGVLRQPTALAAAVWGIMPWNAEDCCGVWILDGQRSPTLGGLQVAGLNNCPGFRPVGVGETWWRILAKCVLVVKGAQTKEACGTEQLCGGLEAGVGGVYTRCGSCGSNTPRRRPRETHWRW